MGQAISLSRLISKRTRSAIDLSGISRTLDAPLDRARSRHLSTQDRAYKVSLDRGVQAVERKSSCTFAPLPEFQWPGCGARSDREEDGSARCINRGLDALPFSNVGLVLDVAS